MMALLDLAHRANVVAELAGVLAALLARRELPDIELLRDQFASRPSVMPQVTVLLPSTSVCDELLGAA